MDLVSSPNVIIWELGEHCELSDLLVGPHIVRARSAPGETQNLTVDSLSFSGRRKLPISWQAPQNKVQGRRGAFGLDVPPSSPLGVYQRPCQRDLA